MKLVTWNTQWCRGLDGVVSPRRIVDGARAMLDFDVLCLQEIAVNYPRLGGDASADQPAQIAQLLPGFQVFFGPAVDEFTAEGRQRFGNLIATRLPVLQVQHHPLPYPADGGVRSMPRMVSMVIVQDPMLGPVRVMTTHLEYYSKKQRMAQAHALRELEAQYIAQALQPPERSDDGSGFQTKTHTLQSLLCGDFNLEAHEPEFAAITQPFAGGQWRDAWPMVHGAKPQAPTFRLYDRTYGPEPLACDFVFVSDALAAHVRSFEIDGATKVSDHQPVAVELGR